MSVKYPQLRERCPVEKEPASVRRFGTSSRGPGRAQRFPIRAAALGRLHARRGRGYVGVVDTVRKPELRRGPEPGLRICSAGSPAAHAVAKIAKRRFGRFPSNDRGLPAPVGASKRWVTRQSDSPATSKHSGNSLTTGDLPPVGSSHCGQMST